MNDMCEYWGYFDEVHDINGHRFKYVREFDWKSEMLHANCIVLAYTQFNLRDLGNGFIEQAYEYFYPSSKH
jgi:hypothetical protein